MWPSPNLRRSNTVNESFSKHRAAKAPSFKAPSFKKRSSFKASSSRKFEAAVEQLNTERSPNSQVSPALTSPIVTLSVGPEQRLFAAHEDVLHNSPYLGSLCQQQFYETNKRIELQNEQPEILSAILEYLYKGDYYPKLSMDRRQRNYTLEDADDPIARSTSVEVEVSTNTGSVVRVLRDTVIYCTAERYGLKELQSLALKKQGLQSNISCGTILNSARYAYEHTPDSDSRLRAHYLALIVRSRSTFKRSGTMQAEMERGGRMFFDLFVAMVNHIDDLSEKTGRR